MLLQHRSIIVHVAALLVWVHTSDVAGSDARCPVGFTFAYEKSLCYRKKGPEVFSDFYKDCVNNRFSLELFNELNISESNAVWTEYKNAYPGGPFLDMAFTKHVSSKLDSDYKVRYQNHSLELEDDLCLVKDPLQSYMAVRCDEKHYRYCFVEPYDSRIVSEGCEDLDDSVAFSSPIATCLTVISGTTEKSTNSVAPVRATWNQAQHLCARRGNSSLLNRGWRYINYDRVRRSERNRVYPLGVIMTSDHSLLRYDATGDHAEIPKSDWNFYGPFNETGLLGAWNGSKWRLVDSSYIFFDVICERTIKPKYVSIHLEVDEENKLVLNASQGVTVDNLYCFTDATLKFPNRVDIHQQSETTFILTPKSEDGYYWCVHIDPVTNKTIETSKALFIREKDSLLNVYAVKLRSSKAYNDDNMESKRKKWEKHLKEYIYYTTKYVQNMGRFPDGNNTEKVLKEFKRGLDDKDVKVIRDIEVKRTYYDERTVLLHVELYPGMETVVPGRWESISVLHMKPVYYCREHLTDYGETVPSMPMGEVTTVGCVTYKCVGDFNAGVQWSMTAREGCLRSTTEKLLLHFMEPVTILMPTLEPGSTARLETQQRDNDSSEESTEKRPQKTTTSTTPCEEETTETVVTSSTPIDFPTISTTEGVVTASTPIFPETTALPTEPTPLPPEEQLLQVMEDLDRLVNETVVMENITTVFDQVNTVLESDEALEIPSRLLHLLDQLGSAVELSGAHTAAAVAGNVALLVADADRDRPVQGLRIAARPGDLFTDDSFEILTHPANATSLDTENSEAVVQLPASVASSSRRISFVVFRNDRAFRPATLDQRFSVNSRILAVNVHNLTSFPKGEVIDIHISPINANITRTERRACAYWHFDSSNSSGYWSTAGCTFIPAARPGLLDTCRCDHLTHFAEILIPRAVFSERNETTLELISVIGCCLSILGLSLVGVTAALFRAWRRDFSNKIWLQLCVSILIMSTCFLIIVFSRFDHYSIGCMLVGILLHYSVLTSFCWMLVAAVLSYRRLVLVFTVEASHKLLRASAFSYGLPCAVVGILLSVAPHSYTGRFEEKTPSGSFCYPSGLALWLSVYAPIAIMLLANWVLFGLIVRSVFASKRIQRHGDKNEALRCASVSCLLVFLFGLPWIFGLFAFNIAAAYLFTITATFQGFVLFMFFILGNKKTRDLWLNKLKIKQTRKVPVTSSTYTNRSTGYRGAIPPSSIEAKESKPRSLTSSDDSKFS